MSAIEHRKRVQERRAAEKAAAKDNPAPQEGDPTTTQVDGDTKKAETPVVSTAMTPQQLQQHAAQLAQTLSQLSEEQYHAALNSLEQTNGTLYAIVCDELSNLAATQENDEGDGYDLNEMTQQ